MLLYCQCCRFRYKSSHSIAFVRIVELEEYRMERHSLFLPLKGYFFVEALKWCITL